VFFCSPQSKPTCCRCRRPVDRKMVVDPTPLAKVLLGSIEPWLLAAVLYLGSGIGLFVVSLVRARRPREVKEVRWTECAVC
jgi:hypothetical protein